MTDRQIAFKVLNRIERDKAYSNLTLDSYLNDNAGSSNAFITALVYGVTERLITLDWLLKGYLRQPLKKLKPEVLTILRMGVYQLKFMDKIPISACVNESVKLSKQSGCSYASGLINSVLRNVSKNDVTYPETENPYFDMSIRFSCPESLVKHFCDDYGIDNARGILECSLGSVPVRVRVNTLKTDTVSLISLLKSDGIEANTCSEIENHIALSGAGSLKHLEEYKNGLFHVQDISSALCVQALDLKENMTLIDLCSAPGGKTFTAAQIMKNKGQILAFDLYEHRTKLIKDGAMRLGIDIIKVQTADASVFNKKLEGIAERVLCDVPCSGLGTIGRKPEIRYKDLSFVDKLTQLQYNILVNASRYLKKNGILVYSTCSLNKKENDYVCDRFLKDYPDFEKINDYVTLMPHINNSDGFFIAALRRK